MTDGILEYTKREQLIGVILGIVKDSEVDAGALDSEDIEQLLRFTAAICETLEAIDAENDTEEAVKQKISFLFNCVITNAASTLIAQK